MRNQTKTLKRKSVRIFFYFVFNKLLLKQLVLPSDQNNNGRNDCSKEYKTTECTQSDDCAEI